MVPIATRAMTTVHSTRLRPAIESPNAMPPSPIRGPKRSAVQSLAGINTASDIRYEVMASFSVRGLAPISAAIAGSEVAITVESMFSMNRAVATMSGIRRSLFIENRGERREEGGWGGVTPRGRGGYWGTPNTTQNRPHTPPGGPVTIYFLAGPLPPRGLLGKGGPS